MSLADENKAQLLDRLAAESGIAVVVVDENSNEVAAANNNSMCRLLYPSAEFGPFCAEYCGKAYGRATAAGKAIEYECYAGLKCRAAPVGKQLVAILGRAFETSENYRRATDKAINGDWRRFRPTEFFDNIIISGSSATLERAERELDVSAADLLEGIEKQPKRGRPRTPEPEPEPPIAEPPPAIEPAEQRPDPLESSLLNYKLPDEPTPSSVSGSRPDPFETSMVNAKIDLSGVLVDQDLADREAWRAFIPTLLKVSYRLACRRILEFLARHYGIQSSLWLQREGQQFEMAAAIGDLEDQPVRIEIPVDDKRIRAAVRDDSPIVLKELQTGSGAKPRVIQLFPVVIGGEVRNALGIARAEIDPELSARILKFCRYVASRLEILRLRDAVAQQERLSRVLKEFNEQLRNIDSESFWQRLTSVTAQLVDAERASLLIRGSSDVLLAKASIGNQADLSTYTDLGSRVAKTILEKGKPALVTDVSKASLSSVAAERSYKTSSFISYPIVFGGTGIGVMNFTDKAGGLRFDKHDLEALDSIAPQIAVALDRIALRDKVGEFAQLSVTDPLTGLLNRRYIEERLSEEINRSDRSGEPLSFLMIDVDEFKSYNDRFGHPAGDEALRVVGSILRQNLRGADVAVRYGGEEFSVLLPNTNTEEAEAIAQRIRSHIARTEFPKRQVTVSIGVASRLNGIQSVNDLISAADKALFRAKETGRNRVLVYDPKLDGGENVH